MRSKVKSGISDLRVSSKKSAPDLILLHFSRACSMSSTSPAVHCTHRGEAAFGMFILWSLSWVGSIQCSIFHRKERFSGVRPGTQPAKTYLSLLKHPLISFLVTFKAGKWLNIANVVTSCTLLKMAWSYCTWNYFIWNYFNWKYIIWQARAELYQAQYSLKGPYHLDKIFSEGYRRHLTLCLTWSVR